MTNGKSNVTTVLGKLKNRIWIYGGNIWDKDGHEDQGIG